MGMEAFRGKRQPGAVGRGQSLVLGEGFSIPSSVTQVQPRSISFLSQLVPTWTVRDCALFGAGTRGCTRRLHAVVMMVLVPGQASQS